MSSNLANNISTQTPQRKKTPKLRLNVQSAAAQREQQQQGFTDESDISTASIDRQCNLDSTVSVNIGNQTNLLISPDSLIVQEQLGRGQYGIVERVLHKQSGSQFAIKRVALAPGDENEKSRLLMDVDILVKGTECENIIKFYGALIWEGDLWILMELMDCSLDRFYKLAHGKFDSSGVDKMKHRTSVLETHEPCTHLSDVIELGNCDLCNPIPERVLGRIAADIVSALSYLYSIKVIHRDIKPSNILINRIGIIKLCDFGISGYLVNSVARTYEAGCRPYMAPERIDPPRDRTGYDIKSDVWSFGITMLEIATGRYPYNHTRNFFEQLKSICADEPPTLTEGRFSHSFHDFLHGCLRKDYKQRPKYDALQVHPFLTSNKHLDIGAFTERILMTGLMKTTD